MITAERIAGVRFLVREGREVVVAGKVPAQAPALHLFLQGSCMGALLLQRGSVPLHGNVVATDRGAVVLAGPVGVGKSTLTLGLLRRGYRLLADDLCAVSLDGDGAAWVQPGFPRLKLWADVCEQFGIDRGALPRIRPELEKFHYPVGEAFCTTPLPLHAVYLLHHAPLEDAALEPLTGVARLTELQAHLYRLPFTEAQQNWPWLFERMSAIARHARVYLLRRPTAGFSIDRLVDLIVGD